MEDEIVYGDSLGPRVTAVTPMENFELLLTFSNGERRIFDAKQLFSVSVFAPLKDRAFFELVKVGYGSVIWPNDIDYCPDTLYSQSTPV